MNLTRRELKFQIPLSLVEPISKYCEMFCEMDKYSAIAPEHYYVINSLYLDSENMVLLERKRANMPRRFSMRIRSYGATPTFPAFMEIKRRADLLINKQRCAITSPATLEFMRDGVGTSPDLSHHVMQLACYHMLNLQLSPRIMTQYQRKAYFGRHDVYSRVTFDRRMRCYNQREYSIFPEPSKFVNYDHSDQYSSEQGNVVLELKCELKVPSWMQELIRRFELRQEQFSKYDSSWSYLTVQRDPHEEFMQVY